MATRSASVGRPAPAYLGPMLALAMGIVVFLAGPLLLFNPWYASFEQARNEVPARLGTTQAEVDRVTSSMIGDLLLVGDFMEALPGQAPLLTDDERSHMRDVGNLLRVLWATLLVAVALAAVAAVALRREPRRLGRALRTAGLAVGTIAIIAAAFFAVAFDQAFLAFHELFFPGGNFLFGPDSNLLRLFPEGLWFEGSLTAGLLIVLSAAAVALAGWRLGRA